MEQKQILDVLNTQYGIRVNKLTPMSAGVGGMTYRVDSMQGQYVVKVADKNEMNHPEKEPEICEFLLRKHIPVSEFVPTLHHELVIPYDDQRICHVQKFMDGFSYAMNTAPVWLMDQMPVILGKVHMMLKNYPSLPTGIGEGFFQYMTPVRALESYRQSLEIAISLNDTQIIEDLEFRIKMAEQMSPAQFDLNRLTICNTHGDYTVNQMICTDSRLLGIIDWTSACQHPVVWELTRSFCYANPGCAEGKIDEDEFGDYIKGYCEIAPLNHYDLRNIKSIYLYQIAVCDYYSQYLNADDTRKQEYLQQAKFATSILKNAYL